MMNNPIYTPSGRAREYGELALNIYTGCPHRCYYCFSPDVLRKDREVFHSHVEPRKGILEAVKKQLAYGEIKGKLIHLCFSCDPYPIGYDTTVTRQIIEVIKNSGNHVQLLTKGMNADRDFDLLDRKDWFGMTISGTGDQIYENEPMASSYLDRLRVLDSAHERGIKTWASFEPVYSTDIVYSNIMFAYYIDLFRIGKLNHHPSDINWAEFGRECVRLCEAHSRAYYIKVDLRDAMKKSGGDGV